MRLFTRRILFKRSLSVYKNNVDAGTALITIKGIGNYIGSAEKKFVIGKAQQQIEASVFSTDLSVDSTTTINVNAQGRVVFSSSSKRIAAVSSEGTVLAKAVGTATISIVASGNENYREASTTLVINVRE